MEHTYENCHNLTCRRKERDFGYNQALEDAEKRYREWSKSEYGKVVSDDALSIRVLRSLRK